MAKTRKTQKNKAITPTKEGKSTPTKIMNGKVAKKRVNVRKLIKSGEENIKTLPSEKQETDGLRAFSVSVEGITSDINRNHKIKTFDAQRKESVIKGKIPSEEECETRNDNLVIKFKRNAAGDKEIQKQMANQYPSKSMKCSSKTNAGILSQEAKDLNEMQNFFSKNKCQTRRQVQTQSSVDYQSPFIKKKCLVRLLKTPNRKIETVMVETATSSPCLDRCVVRLKKYFNDVKAGTNFAESAVPLNTKKCIVRLAKKNYASSASKCFNVPVIDNNKRKYFRKLSLTKSFNKLVDNESPEKMDLSDSEKENKTAPNSINYTEISELNPTLNDANQPQTRKVLTKNKQSNIKQIAKLSLKGSSNKATKSKNVQGEPLEASLHFNPVRNSTLLDFTSTNNNQQKESNVKTKQTSYSKDKSSSQNLANKSNEIENLLNSLDDEEEILMSLLGKANENNNEITKTNRDENNEIQSTFLNDKNKTNKFFHHKDRNVAAEIKEKNSKTPVATKHRRFKTKRSTKIRHDNIYEFLSQSQTSGSDSAKHNDPTADIVKKLIQEGKVQVAVNCKGKGKPKLKPRKRPVRQIKKIKQTGVKKLKQLNNEIKEVALIENQNAANANQKDHFGVDHFDMDHFHNDHFDDDEHFTNIGEEMEIQKKNISNNLNSNTSKNIFNEQEGTFSRLARKVLINQAGHSNSQRKSKTELLKAVRSIISTPINKKTILPHSVLQTDLSPIIKAPQQQVSSPWRVNEDAFLPKTFNFHRSSGNLPSFSSDFIPSTPRKRRSNVYLNGTDPRVTTSPTKNLPNTSFIQSPQADSTENRLMPDLNEPSVISSFSSNDSNAENMPPPKHTPENQNENERIFDTKQLPNPRRALKYRSPLKTINILEIVHLPAYKHPDKNSNTDDNGAKQLQMFGFEEHLDESLKDASKKLKRRTEESLFGFEDYLSQTEVSSQENVEVENDKTTNEQNQTIHEKLQSLRKLKPPENNELNKKITQISKYQIKDIPIFDDVNSKRSDTRQRDIKQMLCSTLLVPQPSTSKEALKQLKNDKFINTKRPNFVEDDNLSVLFTDPEPETTFNESEAHRTYVRPHRRKRRLKENNLVMLLESDESEEEYNSAEKHQRSRESDNSSRETVSKKKRQRKEPKESLAMTEFVKEFNELCKEVENYELVREKSA